MSIWKVYVINLVFVLSIIYPIGWWQATNFDVELEFTFFVAPTLASLFISFLLSRTVLLKLDLQKKSEQFRAMVDLAQEFTYLRGLDGQYEYVSPSCLEFTGYSQEEFYQNKNLMDKLIYPSDQPLWNDHVHQINTQGVSESMDLRIVSKDGQIKWFNHICMSVFDDQLQKVSIRSTNLDITARKNAEERIKHLVYVDELTELGNRRLLHKKLHSYIEKNRASRNFFAVMFIDLDRFKNVNDSFGHKFGDQLLKIISQRIDSSCPKESLVTRYGGDEFVVIPKSVLNSEEAKNLAEKILTEIETTILLDSVELHISASIGISCFPQDGENYDSLIRNADVAMYKIKSEGQEKIKIFDSSEHSPSTSLILTENLIHKGIENNEFEVYYQPKVSLKSGEIVGMEALARWNHPSKGMISPIEFISVAEETGQIVKLGKLLFLQIIKDMKAWIQKDVCLPVAINVSARQFADNHFQQMVEENLLKADIPSSLIEFEVTEQVFLGDLESARTKLYMLKDKGFSISLDDFGTGYSSFSYLRTLPVDTLKIDRSFIQEITSNTTEVEIIRALTNLCLALDIKVIVEGVETKQQIEILADIGCDIIQGYYFHRPMPETLISNLLFERM